MSPAPNIKRGMALFAGVAVVALAAGCNEPAPPTPTIATVTRTVPIDGPPTREVIDPLPSPESAAKDAILGMTTPERAIFRGPSTDTNLPASIRAYPDFQTRLYPPANAKRLKVTAVLEEDAWMRRSEHATDGIALVIKAIGAGDVTMNAVETIIDPFKDPGLQGKPVELVVDIPADAVRLDFEALQRINGAFDATTIILIYE